MKNKSLLTCLSIKCPERFSLCCKAISRSASEPERMFGVPEFFCSKCGKEFKGGKCRADKVVREKSGMKKCPSCKKNTFVVSVFGSICGSCFYEG